MLRTQVRIEYTMTRMTRGEVISAFIHGGKGGDAEAADRLLQKLEEDKSAYSQSFEAMKHGALVTPYLRHGSVYDTRTAKQAMGFSKHMRKHWTCPRCMKKFIVTIDELRQHERDCVAGQTVDPSRLSFGGDEPEQLGEDEESASRAEDSADGSSAVPPVGERSCGSAASPVRAATGEARSLSSGLSWLCSVCDKAFNFTTAERIRHMQTHEIST
jgi:transposase-like protein